MIVRRVKHLKYPKRQRHTNSLTEMSLSEFSIAVTMALEQLLIKEQQRASANTAVYAPIAGALLGIHESLKANEGDPIDADRLIHLLTRLQWLCEVRHQILPSTRLSLTTYSCWTILVRS